MAKDVHDEIGEVIRAATAAGYDVVIKISPTSDGQRGTVTMPIEWMEEWIRVATAHGAWRGESGGIGGVGSYAAQPASDGAIDEK